MSGENRKTQKKTRHMSSTLVRRPFVSPTWSLCNGWLQKLGQVMWQLLGRTPTGNGVGCGSAEGASILNFSTCRQDKASLSRLMQPAICLAWNKIFYLSVERTKCLSRTTIERSLESLLIDYFNHYLVIRKENNAFAAHKRSPNFDCPDNRKEL